MQNGKARRCLSSRRADCSITTLELRLLLSSLRTTCPQNYPPSLSARLVPNSADRDPQTFNRTKSSCFSARRRINILTPNLFSPLHTPTPPDTIPIVEDVRAGRSTCCHPVPHQNSSASEIRHLHAELRGAPGAFVLSEGVLRRGFITIDSKLDYVATVGACGNE